VRAKAGDVAAIQSLSSKPKKRRIDGSFSPPTTISASSTSPERTVCRSTTLERAKARRLRARRRQLRVVATCSREKNPPEITKEIRSTCVPPNRWLLKVGWKRHGLIRSSEVPRSWSSLSRQTLTMEGRVRRTKDCEHARSSKLARALADRPSVARLRPRRWHAAGDENRNQLAVGARYAVHPQLGVGFEVGPTGQLAYFGSGCGGGGSNSIGVHGLYTALVGTFTTN